MSLNIYGGFGEYLVNWYWLLFWTAASFRSKLLDENGWFIPLITEIVASFCGVVCAFTLSGDDCLLEEITVIIFFIVCPYSYLRHILHPNYLNNILWFLYFETGLSVKFPVLQLLLWSVLELLPWKIAEGTGDDFLQ